MAFWNNPPFFWIFTFSFEFLVLMCACDANVISIVFRSGCIIFLTKVLVWRNVVKKWGARGVRNLCDIFRLPTVHRDSVRNENSACVWLVLIPSSQPVDPAFQSPRPLETQVPICLAGCPRSAYDAGWSSGIPKHGAGQRDAAPPTQGSPAAQKRQLRGKQAARGVARGRGLVKSRGLRSLLNPFSHLSFCAWLNREERTPTNNGEKQATFCRLEQVETILCSLFLWHGKTSLRFVRRTV